MHDVNASELLKSFDRRMIRKLIPILERAHSEVVEYSSANGPTSLQLKTEEGRRYWISAEGVNVSIWDPDAVAYCCLMPVHAPHTEYGLKPSEFVERYVKTLDHAREIARFINASL